MLCSLVWRALNLGRSRRVNPGLSLCWSVLGKSPYLSEFLIPQQAVIRINWHNVNIFCKLCCIWFPYKAEAQSPQTVYRRQHTINGYWFRYSSKNRAKISLYPEILSADWDLIKAYAPESLWFSSRFYFPLLIVGLMALISHPATETAISGLRQSLWGSMLLSTGNYRPEQHVGMLKMVLQPLVVHSLPTSLSKVTQNTASVWVGTAMALYQLIDPKRDRGAAT